MNTKTFDVTIDKICDNIMDKILLAVKNAIRETVEEAQTPRNDGGKMPVDTGFLRWSGTASLNQIPSGLKAGRLRNKGEVGVLPEYKMSDKGGKMLNSCLIDMKPGDDFYFGWTARYAPIQEMKCGFMATAAVNFVQHLEKECRRLK